MQIRVFILCLSVSILSGFGQNSLTNPTIEGKIDALLASMTLEEKVGQTCQITLDVILERDSAGNLVEPVKVDPNKVKEALIDYRVGSVLNVGWHTLTLEEWEGIMEGVHRPFEKDEISAPVLYGIDAIHGVNYTVGGTLFPQEIGLAATWNPVFAKDFGEVTAYETRASGIPWNFSPVLDLGRQPLWSRHFETLGEDPYLATAMGDALICGYQGKDGISSEHVAACLKHFVGYSATESGRDRTPGTISTKEMHEYYLPAFKSAINKGALTVMINSGVVNGIPGHINHDLLTKTLKEEWGFEGFAVSDWEDFIMLHTVHRVAPTLKDGIIMAINAGVDMSMVPNTPQYQEYCKLALEAVKEGSISEERLNDAVRRILRVKYIVGLFEKNQGQAKKYPDFGSQKHKDIAQNAALESITLLKNDGMLPLATDQKVLVAGPTSNNLIYLNGAWTHTWQGDNPSFNTEGCLSVREAFEQKLGANCLFSEGVVFANQDGFEATAFADTNDFKTKAAQSDVIVLCLGEFPSTEKPGDIRSLNMTPEQLELAQIAYRTGKPVALVLLEGRPRIIRPIVEGSKAIVQAYLPGDYGGEALVKLCFGEENFSGRLPYTYPRYDGQIEFYDHPRSVDRSKANHFEEYNPQWNFGFGLGYSTVAYNALEIDKKTISEEDELVVKVTVTNTGDVEQKETVQLYLSDHFASYTPQGVVLKRFEKITLAPQESQTVEFTLHADDLKFVDKNGNWILEPGMFSVKSGTVSQDFELK